MAGTARFKYMTLGKWRELTADLPDDYVLWANDVGNITVFTPLTLPAEDVNRPITYGPGPEPGDMVGFVDMLFEEWDVLETTP